MAGGVLRCAVACALTEAAALIDLQTVSWHSLAVHNHGMPARAGTVAAAVAPLVTQPPNAARRPARNTPVHLQPTAARRLAQRHVVVAAAAGGTGGAGGPHGGSVALRQDAWQALQGCQVFLAGKPAPIDIASLWTDSDRIVLVFGRSMG